jgi:hypothetical protein
MPIEVVTEYLQLWDLLWLLPYMFWSSIATGFLFISFFVVGPLHQDNKHTYGNFLPATVQWLSSFFFNRYSYFVKKGHLPRSSLPCSDGKIVPSISFFGGGHLWSFALGIGHHMWKNYDVSECKFLASSCGVFGAVPLVLGLDPYEWCKSDWQKCMDHYNRRHWLLTKLNVGCLNDSKHFYYKLWDDYLPIDAHHRCSGRLFLSTTLYPSLKNHIVSNFESRDKLIWAIVGSICLPVGFIGDFPVEIPGVGSVIDGGFSNDAPCLDTYTVTASALHNKADISPLHLTAEQLGEKYLNDPLTFIDILRTPDFERVWHIARVGELAAAHCPCFQRKEWSMRMYRNQTAGSTSRSRNIRSNGGSASGSSSDGSVRVSISPDRRRSQRLLKSGGSSA